MSKQNCWEFKKCGREPGGKNSAAMGICPASLADNFQGTHYGKRGGRACWVISGTLCGGIAQGTFAKKWQNCFECDFFNRVKHEEGAGFKKPSDLLAKILSR